MDRARQRAHAQLGGVLREARQAAGLTQRQLARRLHRLPSHVSAIESGARRLYIDEFPSYARALGKEPAVFLAAVRASLLG
jgi:transcriptional regulator with XRE-family HTH domain